MYKLFVFITYSNKAMTIHQMILVIISQRFLIT